jgi:hypothetical protein
MATRSPVTQESNVIFDVLTPGMCHSNLFRDDKPWLHAVIERIIMSIVARPTAIGGATIVDAVRPDLPTEAHGSFLMNCKIAEYVSNTESTQVLTSCRNGPNVDSEKGQALHKRFIDELFKKLETVEPGITEVLKQDSK